MKRKGNIKQLTFKVFKQFGNTYLSVDYIRNNEHNHTTYKVNDNFKDNEKNVRNYLNN